MTEPARPKVASSRATSRSSTTRCRRASGRTARRPRRGYAELLAARLRRRRRRHAGVATPTASARTRCSARRGRTSSCSRPSMAAPPSYAAHALAGLDVAARDLERPDDRPAARRAHAGAGDGQLVAGRRGDAREPARPRARSPSRRSRPLRPTPRASSSSCAPCARRPSRRCSAARRSCASASWLPGYLDVESTAAELAQLGVTEHAVAVERAQRRLRGGRRRADRSRPRRASPRAAGSSARATPTSASMRLALALHDLADSANAVARDRQLPLGRAALEPARSGSPPASAPRC